VRPNLVVGVAPSSVVGLPPAGDDVSINIAFSAAGDVETWTRHFGARRLASTQELLWPGADPRQGRLVERFGPFALALDVCASPVGLDLVSNGAWLLGVPLPTRLCPQVAATERVDAGRFCFEVAIDLPLVGRLIRYHGWPVPDGVV
jgi:hypothetical protein